MLKVKSRAELGGGKTAAKPVAAPVSRPVPDAGPKAAAPIDLEMRAMVATMAKNISQLTAVVATQVRMQAAPAPQQAIVPAPQPVVTPEPVPAPVPAQTLIARPPMSIRMPVAAAIVEDTDDAPIATEAKIGRDRKDRLETVSFGEVKAKIARDAKHRMESVSIERDGKTMKAAIHRDSKGRIERMTIQG